MKAIKILGWVIALAIVLPTIPQWKPVTPEQASDMIFATSATMLYMMLFKIWRNGGGKLSRVRINLKPSRSMVESAAD